VCIGVHLWLIFCFAEDIRIRGKFQGARIIGTWLKNPGIRPAVVCRFVVILALASWWGALTFYGMVVVPAGTEQLGSQTQGLVTQQVTRTLNLIGVAVTGLLFFDLLRSGTRTAWALWGTFVICQIVLFVVHIWLSGLLAPAAGSSVDWSWFYDVHRIYLVTTAVQWGAGLWLLWCVIARRPFDGEPRDAVKS
jgi:hypothetical protein